VAIKQMPLLEQADAVRTHTLLFLFI